MDMRALLIQFCNFQMGKKELINQIGKGTLNIQISEPINITANDVVNALVKYEHKEIELNQLIEWVNVIWFSDLFDYADGQDDSIASVMNKLEELDEESTTLSREDIEHYIIALSNNVEV